MGSAAAAGLRWASGSTLDVTVAVAQGLLQWASEESLGQDSRAKMKADSGKTVAVPKVSSGLETTGNSAAIPMHLGFGKTVCSRKKRIMNSKRYKRCKSYIIDL